MMPLLRIGKYKAKGEVRKATLQINDNQPPPSFSHKQRTAHRKLINDTRDIITKNLFHDRIEDVMKWAEMTDIYNPIKDNDSVSDDDDDDTDDESSCGSEMDVDDDYSSIITLMQKSKAIMDEIKTVFVENKRGSATEDDIVKLCTEVRRALVC